MAGFPTGLSIAALVLFLTDMSFNLLIVWT